VQLVACVVVVGAVVFGETGEAHRPEPGAAIEEPVPEEA
jgi:hypothetical protein